MERQSGPHRQRREQGYRVQNPSEEITRISHPPSESQGIGQMEKVLQYS